MNVRACLLAAAVFTLSVTPTEGRDRGPLREVQSGSERFRLRISPGRTQRGEAGHCWATLFERLDEKAGGRKVWSGKLANEIAPVHALIRNDGRFVVTLDEFRRGGAAHAVVVYDARGKLLREFGLRELLHGDDWKHVTVERRAIEWLPEAAFAFVDHPPQFVIRLKWGREIRIDLEKLEIAEDAGAARPEAVAADAQGVSEPTADIPPEILALLAEPTSAPSVPAAATEPVVDEAVRRALEELRRLAEVSGVEVEGLEAVPPAAQVKADTEPAPEDREVGSTTDSPPGSEAPPGTLEASGSMETDQGRFAGSSGATDVPVPAPDPRNPVDYLAWINEYVLTDGPSAVPFYQAAIEGHVRWEGDDELRQAALRGDPEALASPGITEWLAANEEALAAFHEGTLLEYAGMPLESEDGTLIGILLPHLSAMRDLGRATVIEAKVLEANGQTADALDRYLDTFAAGTHAGQGPTLIENLVGMAIHTLGSEGLLDSMANDDTGQIDYVDLAEQMTDAYRPIRPIGETFQFERAMVMDVIQHAYEWNPDTGCYRVSEQGLEEFSRTLGHIGVGSPHELALGFALGLTGFENMAGQANTHYDSMTKAARMPYQGGQEAFRELEAGIDDPAFRYRNPLLAGLLPAMGRAAHASSRSETTRRATLLVTNLRAYRQQYGVYPESLEVFGDAEMVIDPFTDEYFVYRRDGDDFTLYSRGGNGVDDGGVHDRRGDKNDLAFWPRPPKD